MREGTVRVGQEQGGISKRDELLCRERLNERRKKESSVQEEIVKQRRRLEEIGNLRMRFEIKGGDWIVQEEIAKCVCGDWKVKEEIGK